MKRLFFLILLLLVYSVSFSHDYEIEFEAFGECNIIDSINFYNSSQQTSIIIHGDATLHLVGSISSSFRGEDEASYIAGDLFDWEIGEISTNYRLGGSGFNALLAGYPPNCISYAFFRSINKESVWWSSTVVSENLSWVRSIEYKESRIYRGKFTHNQGASMRCILDL